MGSQTTSTPSTNGQAACTPSETKLDAVPAGLSPPLRFSPTELASKVVTTLSSPHKIWSLVIDLTTVAKVVTLTRLGTTSTPLVSSPTLATHTPLAAVTEEPAEALALDLVPGRNTTPKDTAPSEMSTPSSKRFTPTVQSKLVSSSMLISCPTILVSTSTPMVVNSVVAPSRSLVGVLLAPLLTGLLLTPGVPVGVSTVTSGWECTNAASSNKVSLVWLNFDQANDIYAYCMPTL